MIYSKRRKTKDEKGRRKEKRTTRKLFFPFNLVMLFATFAARSCPEYQYKGDIYMSPRGRISRWNSNVPTPFFFIGFSLSFLFSLARLITHGTLYNVSFYSTYSSDRQLPCSLHYDNFFYAFPMTISSIFRESLTIFLKLF